MGAHDLFLKVKTDDRKKVLSVFQEKWDDDRHMYGADSYNGSFSTFHRNELIFVEKTFDSSGEARDYILDRSEKWGAAMAARVVANGFSGFIVGGWAAS